MNANVCVKPLQNPDHPNMPRRPAPPGARRPQMIDIARLAGLSVSSVSRALSGSTEVSEATRARVQALAQQLRYAVHAGASALRTRRSRTIAVVVPAASDHAQRLTDPFLWGLVGAMAEHLTACGYRMLLSRAGPSPQALADDLHAGLAEGLILTGQWWSHSQLNQLAQNGLPLAVWGAERPRQLYATVGTDNFAGGLMATAHLLQQGDRRLLWVGDTLGEEFRQRHLGFVQAHRAIGLRPAEHLHLPCTFDAQAIATGVQGLLASGPPPQGVVAASDLAAVAVIQALQQAGLQVPGDVRVIGYDDVPLAALFNPGLSTIRQPLAQAGQALVDEVLSQVAGHPAANREVPCELVLRGSSQAHLATHNC